MAPIPSVERSPLLKPTVFEFYGRFARLIMEQKSRAQISPLRYMLGPWLEKETVTNPKLEAKRAELLALGIDGAMYVARFEQVLEFDRHLKQCCGFILPLIDHIDRHLGTSLVVNLMGSRHVDEAERDWNDFVDLTYANPLVRFSYTHLFNLKTDHAPIALGRARVEKLAPQTLAEMLGEDLSAVHFFHRPAESEYFLVFEEQGWSTNPEKWLADRQREANEIAFLLQLFKSSVLHTTYTVPFFSPPWVSALWSRVVSPSYLGAFRGSQYSHGQAPYTLDQKEIEALNKWMNFYESPICKKKLSLASNGFGQMLLRSADYYRSSLSREKPHERLVDLAIALESMFTPSSAHTELTFRISQNVSQLIGEDPSTRIDFCKLVKKLYDRRSALLHGQYDYEKFARGDFVSNQELDIWTDLIRKAILRLTVLYFHGECDREKFLAELTTAALDPGRGEQIRKRSDPRELLLENH